MGASQSNTSVDVVNKSIIDTVISNVNNCSILTTQSQQVDFSGVGLFTKVNQSASLNVQCLQNVQITNELLTSMAQKIVQDAQAQAVALMPSYSGSDAVTNLRNLLETKITTSTVQNCAAGVLQRQQVSFSGLQIGSAASQTLDLFSKCMQTVLNNNKVSQSIVQDTDQRARSVTSNPLDFLGNMYSSIAVMIIGIIILIIVIGLIYSKLSSSPSESVTPVNQLSVEVLDKII